jgi:hypothetical protein
MRAVDAIKKIRHIIEAFGIAAKSKGNDSDALMFNALSDINKVVMRPLEG